MNSIFVTSEEEVLVHHKHNHIFGEEGIRSGAAH